MIMHIGADNFKVSCCDTPVKLSVLAITHSVEKLTFLSSAVR